MHNATRLKETITRFRQREDGTTLVEYAICISLFLLILFAIIDFSRLGYNWVAAEKAMQRAARIAAVRPPVCAGVPIYHQRAIGDSSTYPAGTLCSTDGGICQQVDVSCLLSDPDPDVVAAQDTATELWNILVDLLPDQADPSNILIRYNYDPNLGFVGGPYIPVITAEIVGDGDDAGCGGEMCFTFITPLSALAATAGATNTDGVPVEGGTIPFPRISVTVPAEDLNQGMNG